MINQSFGIDEIRRVRDDNHIRYQGMTTEEILKDIAESAKEGYAILERLKREKAKRQGS